MGKALNILLGSVATAMVTVGVAAQTGTVRWPTFSGSPATGGVHAQQAVASPSTESSPPPSAQPSQAPVPVAVAPRPEDPPPPPKKHKG